MLSYDEAIAWLFEQVPMFQNVGAGAYKPGLERVERLMDTFGNPHLNIPRIIHIAGTNGKGSTASTLAAILTASGLKTGLFTSPHLVDFRERIRIDGDMIPKQHVLEFLRMYRSAPDDIEPTFFELTTAMALQYFAHRKVDIAVIECGLGGRLDSTNILTPELSIITNISEDHTALLGDTPEAIASEKAGIIKAGVPVVIGNADHPGVRRVFTEKAAAQGAPIVFAKNAPLTGDYVNTGFEITYNTPEYGTLTSPLAGDCQPENLNTVLHALRLLTVKPTAEAVRRGIAEVSSLSGLQGRWMKLGDNPTVVCDTGHNTGGWQYLGARLRDIASGTGTLRMVIGFVSDKDVSHILESMPRNAVYYFTSPSVKRGLPVEELAARAAAAGLHGHTFASVGEAHAAALADAQPSDTVFVGGSTFVVADLLASR